MVVNKGAMVFHMLRAIIGDANFSALLKDFYSRYAGKSARIQDFEQLAETRQTQPRAGGIQDWATRPPAAVGTAPACGHFSRSGCIPRAFRNSIWSM